VIVVLHDRVFPLRVNLKHRRRRRRRRRRHNHHH